jgi:site-specific DNA-methyltransferase (adenine-specific)
MGFCRGAKARERGIHQGDSGSAARFFFCPKASKKDRDEGCEGLDHEKQHAGQWTTGKRRSKAATKRSNHHPTVKPTALMRYLCRLVTPPGGVVLDPFMGSGSTGKAAMLEGFRFIGIEREAEYVEIARARIGAVLS